MEEIKIDPSQFSLSQEEFASLQALIMKSKDEGAQIGVPWNKRVYDYFFETGFMINPSVLLGDEYNFDNMDDELI